MEHQDEQDRQAQIAKDGQQAEVLLGHPLVQRFLREQRDKLWGAYQRLPMPASQDEYVSIQAYLQALDDFETELRGHVERWGHEKDLMERDEANKGDIGL